MTPINVLVSAAIIGRNPEAVILLVIKNRERFEWVVSEEILTEYQAVLSRSRLRITEEDRQIWLRLLEDSTVTIEVDMAIDFPRDRQDAKFLACAIAANADFLLTGDRDFSEAQSLLNTMD